MKLNYRVLHVQTTDVQMEVVVNGQTGTFTTKRCIIELLPEGHEGGVIQINLDPETTEFVEDTICSVDFDNPPAVAAVAVDATAEGA